MLLGLQYVYQDPKLSLRVKRMLDTGCVVSLLLYGSGRCPILERDKVRQVGYVSPPVFPSYFECVSSSVAVGAY